MRLRRYRVSNFRSIDDSGWVDVENVTALIGVNESGKTNLLLPLWKFNPAQEGGIIPTADYPKKRFAEMRANPSDFQFIEVEFDCSDLAQALSSMTGYPEGELTLLSVSRWLDGRYTWNFPDIKRPNAVPGSELKSILTTCISDLETASVLKGEVQVQEKLLAALNKRLRETALMDTVQKASLTVSSSEIKSALPNDPAKTSVLVPRAEQAIAQIEDLVARVTRTLPQEMEGIHEYIVSQLPTFVYYSNYGNLDSEIYLPHVVDNLGRDDLGAKEAAKARSLRVLFQFVQLEPAEILDLGRELPGETSGGRLSDSEVEEVATRKKERSILLQSAGTRLTERFREWWKQGNYRFRFEADGNHFRIWVSDELRPQEIELENRSTGLQWFLSFYLVFLVESIDAHRNSILLLDEPGLSLHPLAQRDLSDFFESLSVANQLLYTTHSPFLIDADRLDRARKVFVNADGATEATADLRSSPSSRQEGASYAVYSALNLNLAESMLLGCTPIIVEGPSDQHYLTTIKTILIREGQINPPRDLVFPPSGGVKTAKAIASMLGSKEGDVPLILLDGDLAGINFSENAKKGLYAGSDDRIKLVTDFLPMENAEIEDLFSAKFLAPIVDRVWRVSDVQFQDTVDASSAIVPQIERWAKSEDIILQIGWKVDLAREAKRVALSKGAGTFDPDLIALWKRVFDWFSA
jgi:AAA domain, putative AbiEii toxin, Type IV TA system